MQPDTRQIEQEEQTERELRINLALLQAAATIAAGTSIATKTDMKPDEVPALARLVHLLWREISGE
jgi:hypothetical protein